MDWWDDTEAAGARREEDALSDSGDVLLDQLYADADNTSLYQLSGSVVGGAVAATTPALTTMAMVHNDDGGGIGIGIGIGDEGSDHSSLYKLSGSLAEGDMNQAATTMTNHVRVHDNYLDMFGAVQAGNLAAVFRFLDVKGIDLEQRSPVTGLTALLLAAETGHLSIVELLLNRGADIDATDEQGRTALFLATERGHVDIVSLLLEKGCDTEVTDDLHGQTPLLRCASSGYTDMCAVLLDHGADPFYQDMEGRTAHDLALDEVTKTLLRSNSQGIAVLSRSSSASFVDLTKGSCVVRSPTKQHSPLRPVAESLLLSDYFAAVREGDVDRVTSLLEDNDNDDNNGDGGTTMRWKLVDAEEEDFTSGRTALALAAAQGHVGVVETLLRHGAAIDKCGSRVGNKTALFFAAAQGHEATVALLLQHGADTEICCTSEGEEGWTPLIAAAAAGNLSIVNLLVTHGAQTDTVDMEGRSTIDLCPDDATKERLRSIDEQRRQQQAEDWANQQKLLQQQQQQQQEREQEREREELEASAIRAAAEASATDEAKVLTAVLAENDVVPSQSASHEEEVFDDADADAVSLYQLSGSVGEAAIESMAVPVLPSVQAPVKTVGDSLFGPPAAITATVDVIEATTPVLTTMATLHNDNDGGNDVGDVTVDGDEGSDNLSLYQLSGSAAEGDTGYVEESAIAIVLPTTGLAKSYEAGTRAQLDISVKSDRAQLDISVKSDLAHSDIVVGVPVVAATIAPLTGEVSGERWEGQREERQGGEMQVEEGQGVTEELTARPEQPALPAATVSVLPSTADNVGEGGLSADKVGERGLSTPPEDVGNTVISTTSSLSSRKGPELELTPGQELELAAGQASGQGEGLVQGPPDDILDMGVDAMSSGASPPSSSPLLSAQPQPLNPPPRHSSEPPPTHVADTSHSSSMLLPDGHDHNQQQGVGVGLGVGLGVALGLLPSSSVCSVVVYGEAVVVDDDDGVGAYGGGGGGEDGNAGGGSGSGVDGGNDNAYDNDGYDDDGYDDEERIGTALKDGSTHDPTGTAMAPTPSSDTPEPEPEQQSSEIHHSHTTLNAYLSSEAGDEDRYTANPSAAASANVSASASASARIESYRRFAGTRPNPNASTLPMVWDGEMGDTTTSRSPRLGGGSAAGSMKMFKNKEKKPISGRQVTMTQPPSTFPVNTPIFSVNTPLHYQHHLAPFPSPVNTPPFYQHPLTPPPFPPSLYLP